MADLCPYDGFMSVDLEPPFACSSLDGDSIGMLHSSYPETSFAVSKKSLNFS